MNIGTTNIDSLPISPQTNNIRLETHERDQKINVPQYEREDDQIAMQKNLNQFVTGIQQASAAGLTALPSRDIPQNQDQIVQDVCIKPNYIPQQAMGHGDYIQQHQTNEEIIRAQAKSQEKKETLDCLYDELQTPILIAILYFLFQLPIVKKQLLHFLPSIFNKDGNPNLSGYIVSSISFAGIYFAVVKVMHFLER